MILTFRQYLRSDYSINMMKHVGILLAVLTVMFFIVSSLAGVFMWNVLIFWISTCLIITVVGMLIAYYIMEVLPNSVV